MITPLICYRDTFSSTVILKDIYQGFIVIQHICQQCWLTVRRTANFSSLHLSEIPLELQWSVWHLPAAVFQPTVCSWSKCHFLVNRKLQHLFSEVFADVEEWFFYSVFWRGHGPAASAIFNAPFPQRQPVSQPSSSLLPSVNLWLREGRHHLKAKDNIMVLVLFNPL